MNKKEISEIKKLFKRENYNIDNLVACYVSIEKEKTAILDEGLISLSDEELIEHLEILKKSLSGVLGKNLLNFEFPLEEEFENGKQKFLLELRDSGLKNRELLDKFFDKIIERYPANEKYYIVLAHGNYDIKNIAKDNTEIFDSSDYIYEYILCTICPVKLSKSGLCYDSTENRIGELEREWTVLPPERAFLFPSFEDRLPNIHRLLYYTKNPEDNLEEFLLDIFGVTPPLSPNTQKEAINDLISENLGSELDLSTVKKLRNNIKEAIEENKETEIPLELDATAVKNILKSSGIKEESLENFEEEYNEIVGEDKLILAENLLGTKQLNIRLEDVEIKIRPDAIAKVREMEVDGIRSIVIPINEVIEVNGLKIG